MLCACGRKKAFVTSKVSAGAGIHRTSGNPNMPTVSCWFWRWPMPGSFLRKSYCVKALPLSNASLSVVLALGSAFSGVLCAIFVRRLNFTCPYFSTFALSLPSPMYKNCRFVSLRGGKGRVRGEILTELCHSLLLNFNFRSDINGFNQNPLYIKDLIAILVIIE